VGRSGDGAEHINGVCVLKLVVTQLPGAVVTDKSGVVNQDLRGPETGYELFKTVFQASLRCCICANPDHRLRSVSVSVQRRRHAVERVLAAGDEPHGHAVTESAGDRGSNSRSGSDDEDS
jgi:hypothetical protein